VSMASLLILVYVIVDDLQNKMESNQSKPKKLSEAEKKYVEWIKYCELQKKVGPLKIWELLTESGRVQEFVPSCVIAYF
jgi:hypothetical protein